MTEVKFTPGPWEQIDNGLDEGSGKASSRVWSIVQPALYAVDRPDHGYIADVYFGHIGCGDTPAEVCQANADLITEAPNLYGALEKACEALFEAEDKFWIGHLNHPGDSHIRDKGSLAARHARENKQNLADKCEEMKQAGDAAKAALKKASGADE